MARSRIAVRVEGRPARASFGRVRPAALRGWAAPMLAALELGDAELSIVLCDDPFIHELNRRFADEDHATDVLAFALAEGPGPHASGLLGDVVISIETASRQAAQRRAPVEDEVLLLLAHGLLHLVGYDHRTAAEKRLMTARTDVLIAAARAPAPRRRRP